VIKTIFTVVLTVVLSPIVTAAMQPMTDEELGIQTGQAFFQIDRSTNPQNVDFTKFTFGMDIDISVNADLLELGRYDRSGEALGSSDIRINDFALGSVNNDGTLNPFHITDPFFELAFEDVSGKEELVGIRLGFGGARGALSGNIESLTGNVNVLIRDTAAGLANADNGLADLTAGLLKNSPIEAEAALVRADGTPDNIRATKIGIPNGDTFDIVPDGWWDRLKLSVAAGLGIGGLDCVSGSFGSCRRAQITATNCAAAGINVCFNLSDYRTLQVGNKQSDGSFTEASGLFLSFQSKSVSWIDTGKVTPTVSGAFMNIPNGGLTVTLEEAFNGTQRLRTKFMDPYYD